MTTTAPYPTKAGVDVLSVSRLNDAVRALLEDAFPLVWVEGEISNLSRPRSGHLYFSLKDDAAQVRCAMFRNRNILLRFRPSDGARVLVRARVSLYGARGDFQLIVEQLEDAGEGALRRQFDALRNRLEHEGLFASARKRSLPTFPRRVGVVTSPTGAALRDILHVLERRFPALAVLIYPTPVQGASAAAEIARQIAVAGGRNECDLLLVTRGGGSLEDLWAFNEEIVARAIADSPLPVVSAVGHETDVTIADLTADVRAPTPSAAAEIISPSNAELVDRLSRLLGALQRSVRGKLASHAQRLDGLERRVANQHPHRRLAQYGERVRQLQKRLHGASAVRRQNWRARALALRVRLFARSPRNGIERCRDRAQTTETRLFLAARVRLSEARSRLAGAMRGLDLASPLGTLERGYAVITRCDDDSVVRNANQTTIGDELEARLARGKIRARVISKQG